MEQNQKLAWKLAAQEMEAPPAFLNCATLSGTGNVHILQVSRQGGPRMFDAPEMSHASQLITEIEASGLATLKQIAFWSGLHENTVRDYRDGRIRHFGAESRFWNGVLVGLCRHHQPGIPEVCFRIIGMLLKGSPLAAVSVMAPALDDDRPLANVMHQFAAIARDLADAADAAATLYEQPGGVDAATNPSVAELESKIDRIINGAWRIKHRLGQAKHSGAPRP